MVKTRDRRRRVPRNKRPFTSLKRHYSVFITESRRERLVTFSLLKSQDLYGETGRVSSGRVETYPFSFFTLTLDLPLRKSTSPQSNRNVVRRFEGLIESLERNERVVE